jgi:hypothetical protein
MKRIFTVGVLSVIGSLSISAAQQTLTGEISDSMCGASHAGMGDMGKNAKECTSTCVKSGAKYVFLTKRKVYAIQNQDFGALVANAGTPVQVQGEVNEDAKTIRIRTVGRVGK